MGMSASQARYLQLTSRMSDLELEGQQINQQRLNLANQTASISEQALRMKVPTAPSPYDFMKEAYEGTIGGKNVIISNNDDGTKTVAMQNSDVKSMEAIGISNAERKPVLTKIETPSPQGAEITATYQEETTAKCITNGTEIISADKYAEMEKNVADLETSLNEAKSKVEAAQTKNTNAKNDYNTAKKYYDSIKNDNSVSPNEKAEANNKQTNKYRLYQMASGELSAAIAAKERAENEYNNEKAKLDAFSEVEYYTLGEGVTTVTANNGTISPEPKYNSHGVNGKDGVPKLELKWNSQVDLKSEQTGSAEELKAASKGCSKNQIDLIKKEYVTSDGEEPTFDLKTGLVTCELYKDTGVETIGGDKAYKLTDISTLKSQNNVNDIDLTELIARIKNYELNANNGTINSESLNQWRIVVKGGVAPEAVKIADDSSVQNFKETEMKEGFEEAEIIGEDIKKSGLGTVTIKCSDGTEKKVTVQKTQVKDDNAYGDAVAKYENDKAEYDRAQEDFNQKTKKIQEQDKQLELKLKRLDTERNALNTEIDAVKKVIQDNSDKSFKTFSG